MPVRRENDWPMRLSERREVVLHARLEYSEWTSVTRRPARSSHKKTESLPLLKHSDEGATAAAVERHRPDTFACAYPKGCFIFWRRYGITYKIDNLRRYTHPSIYIPITEGCENAEKILYVRPWPVPTIVPCKSTRCGVWSLRKFAFSIALLSFVAPTASRYHRRWICSLLRHFDTQHTLSSLRLIVPKKVMVHYTFHTTW